jgi:hypothetical protein
MRQRFSRWLVSAWRRLNPRDPVPALREENRALREIASDAQSTRERQLADARRFLAEMVEAQAMCGAGPWGPGDVDAFAHASKPLQEALQLKEAGPVGDVSPLGAYGLYELLLQNVNWQREINYSWLEFTRWGIQQIILITRLYYIKNPIIRRLVDVCAQYVFARGCDITSEDPDANDAIKAFLERNKRVLGRCALMEAEKSKDRDGNLFWVFFTDKSTGDVDVRMIDATEIQDIWTDPGDADVPWLYQRIWTQRAHDPASGAQATKTQQAWYPAVDYSPPDQPDQINGHPVMWDTPVYHRKVGQVGKWLFGCPRLYPAIDWAKEARRRLEACASQAQSLAQFAIDVTTKGGQQGIEGWKQQMQTQVGPGAPIWDPNPPAVAGSTIIHGPGSKIEAFQGAKAEMDPERVRWYIIMCCMVKGLPPTFLGDMQTSNLATATSLDRPTETVFLSLQEEWIEDLTTIVSFALSKSLRAPNGKLREACANPGAITIRGQARALDSQGRMRYVEKKALAKGDDIEVRVDFPAIREGDIPAQITATVAAMTLGNRGGQIVGIDEKAGVLELSRLVDLPEPEETVDAQYPPTGKDKYNPNRVEKDLPAPIPTAPPIAPGGAPQAQPASVASTVATQTGKQPPPPGGVKEAVRTAFARLAEAVGERLNGAD